MRDPSISLAVALQAALLRRTRVAGMRNHLDRQLDVIESFLLEQIEDHGRQLLKQSLQARSFGVHAFEIAGLDEQTAASAS